MEDIPYISRRQDRKGRFPWCNNMSYAFLISAERDMFSVSIWRQKDAVPASRHASYVLRITSGGHAIHTGRTVWIHVARRNHLSRELYLHLGVFICRFWKLSWDRVTVPYSRLFHNTTIRWLVFRKFRYAVFSLQRSCQDSNQVLISYSMTLSASAGYTLKDLPQYDSFQIGFA